MLDILFIYYYLLEKVLWSNILVLEMRTFFFPLTYFKNDKFGRKVSYY